ncbi:hypothetical protein C8J57DRAFT_691866 [Mycena rebaudengoi]|nr:hypothetical protein C8J57DRAFT_691866 [Mycena rebaudengoi]
MQAAHWHCRTHTARRWSLCPFADRNIQSAPSQLLPAYHPATYRDPLLAPQNPLLAPKDDPLSSCRLSARCAVRLAMGDARAGYHPLRPRSRDCIHSANGMWADVFSFPAGRALSLRSFVSIHSILIRFVHSMTRRHSRRLWMEGPLSSESSNQSAINSTMSSIPFQSRLPSPAAGRLVRRLPGVSWPPSQTLPPDITFPGAH